MISEREFVIDSFIENFTQFKNNPIVIYGLGLNTKFILEELDEYNVVGLMDEVRTGEIVYGKKVLDFDEVKNLCVKQIIIIARASNVPIIYRRIRQFCESEDITVYDINGNIVGSSGDVWKWDDIKYSSINLNILKKKMDKADVVSFDMFDTLVMRKLLLPTDVFEELESTNNIEGFARIRILAERELYINKQPTLQDIYKKIEEYIPGVDIDGFSEREIENEKKILVARDNMLQLFDYARNKGKKIIIVSDMYLSSDVLHSILQANGYDIAQEDIYVSCEKGVSKHDGLFEVVKEEFKDKKILHIGDNYESDVVCAKQSGIEDVFEIKSAYSMLEDSSARNLLTYSDSLERRKVIGMFACSQFSNPFTFEKTSGKVEIKSEYEMGFYFLAPLMSLLTKWLINEVNNKNIDIMLLGARDGYIIKELFTILEESSNEITFKYPYFYCSRAVCTLAGIINDEDILHVSRLAFSGPIESMLKKRFGLNEGQVLVRQVGEKDAEYIMRHKKAILENVKIAKENFVAYIDRCLDEGWREKKIGFFDFVSSGTCHFFLEKLCDVSINGFYVSRIYEEYKKSLRVDTLYEMSTVYENKYAIMNKYLFLENVFSSPEASVVCFSNEGDPVLGKESRELKQLMSMKKIHDGICDGFREIGSHWEYGANDLEFVDTFISLIDKNNAWIEMGYFKDNPLVDEFCNRSFNMSDM